MKIEFVDQKGAKYSVAVEGPSKESIIQLLDFIQAISPTEKEDLVDSVISDTNFNKVLGIVQNKFRSGAFTSKHVLEAYEQHFHLHTTLSTISTYLSRLAERGVLDRHRDGSGWTYKLIRAQRQAHDTLTHDTENYELSQNRAELPAQNEQL